MKSKTQKKNFKNFKKSKKSKKKSYYIGKNNQLIGKKFEQFVAQIFIDLGKNNVRTNIIKKKRNYCSEFDIVYGFIRKHYVECKYKNPKDRVTATEVSIFAKKLDLYNINNTLASIVTNRHLSSKARDICKKSHIKVIERSQLKNLDYERLNLMNSIKYKFSDSYPCLEQRIKRYA